MDKLFVLVIVSLVLAYVADSRAIKENAYVLQRPSVKPSEAPLKTIKTEGGDVIDCVHIYAQPAFNHPLLKDHVIQISPRWLPNAGGDKGSRLCPEWSVPILRLPKDAKRVVHPPPRRVNLISSNFPMADGTPEYSAQRGRFPDGYDIYGGKASLNVWNPQTSVDGEYSTVRVILLSGDHTSDVYQESLEAGWMVFKARYGDPLTRFYSYWRNANGEGCYDLDCQGFIQTSSNIHLAQKLEPSVYGGQQNTIDIQIFKDFDDNWWLLYNGERVGYWPSNLFTYLNNWANMTEFGGEVLNSKPGGHHTSTQMGNGHSAFEEEGKACKVSNMRYFNKDRNDKQMANSYGVATNEDCYEYAYFNSLGTPEHLFIGGSGYGPKCP